ncbi:hypothetical protein [Asanoa iriomotensis]|uniref:Uncharacterized protein n=1 Tax=Asanoa iriomotensis TaxID=234613 RepID=A0ABQ4CEU8_9ACTN|nr:hypothetical protein [Asanoa iriomotensis]GIF61277.1 hypothetical protein Air01nite_73720 [Asanoa iriomotensis]
MSILPRHPERPDASVPALVEQLARVPYDTLVGKLRTMLGHESTEADSPLWPALTLLNAINEAEREAQR